MPRDIAQAFGFLLGFWLALWMSPLSVNATEARSDPQAPFASLEDALHQEINSVRAQRHLIRLERMPDLDAVARAHSRDMVQRRYLAHASPEGDIAVDRLHAARIAGASRASAWPPRTSAPRIAPTRTARSSRAGSSPPSTARTCSPRPSTPPESESPEHRTARSSTPRYTSPTRAEAPHRIAVEPELQSRGHRSLPGMTDRNGDSGDFGRLLCLERIETIPWQRGANGPHAGRQSHTEQR
jgi:hypothetical protein